MHNIGLHNPFIFKNPQTPQGRDVCAIYIHLQTEPKRRDDIPLLLGGKK